MNVLWAIQRFAVNDADSQGMLEAVQIAGAQSTILEVAPYDYRKIDLPVFNGPIIPYGGTKMIEAIAGTRKYTGADEEMVPVCPLKGWTCWFNENFKYHIEIEKYGSRMFNGDGVFMNLGAFSPRNWEQHEYIFIRPDKDTKEFAGNVIRPYDFAQWHKRLMEKSSSENWGVDERTEIIVAPASRIDEEWRIFVVDNCIIDGSRYRKLHRLNVDHYVPDKVFDYVKETIAIWQPAPVFVMDICRVSDSLSVLEVGDFHSAGWYAADKGKIVKAVSEFAERSHAKL